MYTNRVILFADRACTRALRVLHPQAADRLVTAGQAVPLYSGRRTRALVLSGGGEDDPAPWSEAIQQEIESAEGVIGHCWGMKILEAGLVTVI